MEAPQVQRIRPEIEDRVRCSGRWHRRSVKVAREKTTIGAAELEALLCRRGPDQHARAVVGADVGALERAREHVEGDVVGVRPDRELRVIVEQRAAVTERVAIIRTGRIGGRRDRDTLEIWRRGDRELGEDPTVRDLVVLDDRVAVVVRLAPATEPRPDRVACLREARQDRARCLVEDGQVHVHPLDVLRRPDRPDRIRWRIPRREAVVAVADAGNAEAGGGRERGSGGLLGGSVGSVGVAARSDELQWAFTEVGGRWRRCAHRAERPGNVMANRCRDDGAVRGRRGLAQRGRREEPGHGDHGDRRRSKHETSDAHGAP